MTSEQEQLMQDYLDKHPIERKDEEWLRKPLPEKKESIFNNVLPPEFKLAEHNGAK